jgi:hypothetical protein
MRRLFNFCASGCAHESFKTTAERYAKHEAVTGAQQKNQNPKTDAQKSRHTIDLRAHATAASSEGQAPVARRFADPGKIWNCVARLLVGRMLDGRTMRAR